MAAQVSSRKPRTSYTRGMGYRRADRQRGLEIAPRGGGWSTVLRAAPRSTRCRGRSSRPPGRSVDGVPTGTTSGHTRRLPPPIVRVAGDRGGVLLSTSRDEGRQADVRWASARLWLHRLATPTGSADRGTRHAGCGRRSARGGGRDQDRRAPVGLVHVALGGGLGEQRPGRLAVWCKRHGPLRRRYRLGVAGQSRVPARLRQLASGDASLGTRSNVVDDPLRPGDVRHVQEQQQADLDPRPRARTGCHRDAVQDGQRNLAISHAPRPTASIRAAGPSAAHQGSPRARRRHGPPYQSPTSRGSPWRARAADRGSAWTPGRVRRRSSA